MALPTCFFHRDGARFVPTELTRGPWSNLHQHGGPPSALLARAAEGFGDDAAQFMLARLTVEYFKPVPLTPLEVTVRPLKLGGKVHRLEVSLASAGVELVRASAIRVRRGELAVEAPRPPAPVPPPESFPVFEIPFFQSEIAYHRGIEGRYAKGTFGDTSVTVWMKPTAPLVDGELTSAAARTVLLVDAESGLCPPVDVFRYTFINPDLTVYLDREPRGEWLGLEVRSTASRLGVGLAQSALFDLDGQVGRSAQALVVEAR